VATGNIAGLALTARGTDLVVSAVDADSGQRWPLRRYTAANGNGWGSVVADPLGRFVLADAGGQVRAFAFDGQTGELSTDSAAVAAPGVDLRQLRITPDGRFAYQPTTDRRVRGFAVDGSGRLTELAGSPFGTPVLEEFSEILFHADGGYLFVNARGVRVARPELPKSLYDPHRPVPVFRIDAATGALTRVAREPLGDDETGAIALAGSRHAWVQRQDGSWRLHAFDTGSGQLRPVAPELRIGDWSTELAAVAGGTVLIVSSNVGGVTQQQAYRVDLEAPGLAPLGGPLRLPGSPQSELDRLRLNDVVVAAGSQGLQPTAILASSTAAALLPRKPSPWRAVTYGLDAVNGRVRVLQVSPEDGTLAELADASTPVPGVPRTLAHSVDRGWIAVLSTSADGAGTVSLLRIDRATGRLTPAGSASTGKQPVALAFGGQPRLYVATAEGIDAFDVDAAGGLRKLAASPIPVAYGPRTSDPATSAQPLTDRLPADLNYNGFLFVATNKGSLGEVSSLFEASPGSVFQGVLGPVHNGPTGCMNGPGAQGSTLTEAGSGTIALAAAGLRVLYALNRDSATVTGHFAQQIPSCPTVTFMRPLPGSPVSTGSQPVAMALDAARRHLFIANTGGGGSVSVFAVDTNGALTAAPGSPFPLARVPARLWTDASGAFLYTSDAAGQVDVLAVDRSSGGLGAPRRATGLPVHFAADLVLGIR
jgi:6-phosphogluconolactonase (cycloisomerase 2 family)